MNKELIEKYYNNSCTEEELNSVLEWFEGPSRTPEGKALLFKIWEELPDEESDLKINFNLILDKIHHKVNLAHPKKLLEKADLNFKKYNRRNQLINIFSRAAAILILPVLSLGLYMSFKYQSIRQKQNSVNKAYNEVFSSVDAITKVSLPDGSIAWLNHNSRLKYPAMFMGDSRMVELIGEGYFEVAHNPKIPFVVKAGEIQVLARGTTFNILAYQDDDRIETSLIEGNVEIQRLDANRNLVQLLRIKQSDLAVFQKSSNEISIRTIVDDRYFSWKDGKLVFQKESMREVVKKLNRWFNVDIQLKDPELLELTYTATFVHETLPQVMELLAMISPISYSISNREENSNGTFTKRKIILSYKKHT